MPKTETPYSAADLVDSVDAVDAIAISPSRRPVPRRSAAGRFVARSVLLRSVLLSALGLLGLSACGADNPARPPEPPESSELYWGLALNHEAITLATGASYDTLRLTAVPLKSTGEALADLPTPSYVSQGPAKVVVTPDGVLHALEATAQPVVVIARLTVDNVTHADSVLVRVVDTADPPVLATFALPPAVDSAKVAVEPLGIQVGMPPLSVQAADDQGRPMNDLLVAFRSSDELIATIDPSTGQIAGKWPGPVTFYASATVFGVSKTDSVRYRIGAPIFYFLSLASIDGSLSPDVPTFTLGVGAAMLFVGSAETDTVSVEFDEAAVSNLGPGASFSELNRSFFLRYVCQISDCNSVGNMVLAPPIPYAVRVFTAPGVYDYRCTACRYKAGRIIVVDERQP